MPLTSESCTLTLKRENISINYGYRPGNVCQTPYEIFIELKSPEKKYVTITHCTRNHFRCAALIKWMQTLSMDFLTTLVKSVEACERTQVAKIYEAAKDYVLGDLKYRDRGIAVELIEQRLREKKLRE